MMNFVLSVVAVLIAVAFLVSSIGILCLGVGVVGFVIESCADDDNHVPGFHKPIVTVDYNMPKTINYKFVDDEAEDFSNL